MTCAELTRGADAPLARIQSQHDLPQRNDVVAAGFLGLDGERFHRGPQSAGSRTGMKSEKWEAAPGCHRPCACRVMARLADSGAMRETLRAWTESLETFVLEVILEQRRGKRAAIAFVGNLDSPLRRQ